MGIRRRTRRIRRWYRRREYSAGMLAAQIIFVAVCAVAAATVVVWAL
ncbi:hypothetical protein [Cryobacterium arcticum]|nr:hypothetical protein [Cryobacterium arcticum]